MRIHAAKSPRSFFPRCTLTLQFACYTRSKMPRDKRRRRQNYRHDPVTSAPTAQDDVTPLTGSTSPAVSVSSSESTVIAPTSTDARASVSSVSSASTVTTEDVGATQPLTTASPARSLTQNHVDILVEVGDQANNANYDSDPEIGWLLREIFGDTLQLSDNVLELRSSTSTGIDILVQLTREKNNIPVQLLSPAAVQREV